MKWQQQSFLFSSMPRLIQSMQYQKGASILHEKQNHAIQQARVGPTAHANAYISHASATSMAINEVIEEPLALKSFVSTGAKKTT